MKWSQSLCLERHEGFLQDWRQKPWINPGFWEGVYPPLGCLGLGLAVKEGWVDTSPESWIDPKPFGSSFTFPYDMLVAFQVLKENMDKTCKCHGVSGSCTVRVCWRVMPNIARVGDLLRLRFNRATRVQLNKSEKKIIRVNRERRGKSRKSNSKRPGSGELVYASASPNFCHANSKLGFLGTVGRACNPASSGTDSCRMMCCGRDYATERGMKPTKCNCQFVWCCNIKCDVCNQPWVEHRCK